MKREPPTIWAEDKIPDTHRNGDQLLSYPTRCGCRVNIRTRKLVVRLFDALRDEVNSHAIMAPKQVLVVEISARELHRGKKFIGVRWRFEHPDMAVALGIEIALVVAAIHGTANNVHVGFVLALCLPVTSLLLALHFLDVFLCGRARKGDPFAVWRPDRVRGSFWQMGNYPSLASAEWQQRQL